MKPIKTALFSFIAVILSLAAGFLIAEIGFRIFAPQQIGPVQHIYDNQLGLIPIPEQRGRRILPGTYDYTYTNNSLGMRGSKEYSYEKHTDYRILALGDSFVYGVGVDDDQTFCHLLEKKLTSENRTVEIVNAGNPGTGTDYALKYLRLNADKFKPDITIVFFFSNDFEDILNQAYFKLEDDGSLLEKPPDSYIALKNSIVFRSPLLFKTYNWAISWSHTVNFFKHSIYELIGKRRTTRAAAAKPQSPIEEENGFRDRLTEILFSSVKTELEKTGGDLLVFYIPHVLEVIAYKNEETYSPNETALKTILENPGISFFSLTPVMAKIDTEEQSLYYPNEGHWTPLAHKIAAEFMAGIVENLIEQQPPPGE